MEEWTHDKEMGGRKLSFLQKFTEHFLCARHFLSTQGISVNKTGRNPCLHGALDPGRGETDKKPNK